MLYNDFHVQLQKWIKVTEIPTDSTDQPADSAENPLVKWLAENNIKKMTAIISECKKRANKDDEQKDNDCEEKPDDEEEKKSHVSDDIPSIFQENDFQLFKGLISNLRCRYYNSSNTIVVLWILRCINGPYKPQQCAAIWSS